MSGVRMIIIFLALDTCTFVTQKLGFYYFYYEIKISIALDATGAGDAALVANTDGWQNLFCASRLANLMARLWAAWC